MKSLVVILSVAFMEIFNVPNCKCVSTDSIKAEIEVSDLVMVGDVVGKNIISKFTAPNNKIKLMAYKIRVHKSYKGIHRDKIIYLYTSLNGASCGIKLKKNQRYVVFGKKGSYLPKKLYKFIDEKELRSYWISKCSKTQLFDVKVEEEIEKEINR